ncbi:hypothetical protein [Pseudomonas sp.]|uniref:hypothetical protein n=1 Tax=Pseudomonas sp. TaxID=306 RepID=UPI003FD8A1BE
MSDYTNLQSRCQRGEASLAGANNLLAECHAALGQLMAENERLKTLRSVTERDLAQELEVWRNGPSCWSCGDTGDVHDIVGEWRGQCDCNAAKLIDAASERDQIRAEVAGIKTGYEAYERVNAELKAEVEGLRKIISDSATSCGAAVSVECTLDFMKHLPVEIFSVISKLRNALAECADSLHGEMLQKFGGQLPDDMHPVTRREYDRDMAEVAGYRVALGQGEQS